MRDATGHRRNPFKFLSRYNGRKRQVTSAMHSITEGIDSGYMHDNNAKGVIKFSHAIPLSVMIIGLSEVQLGLLS